MYSVSMMSAASAKRSMLMDIALRGYLMDQAQKQGMTEDEARDAVDQQIAQAKRSKASIGFDDVVHEFMESDVKDNPVENAQVVKNDPAPERETSVSQNERLFSSRTLQEVVPVVTAPVGQPSAAKEQEQEDMVERVNSLYAMSTKELRKLVRENSKKKIVEEHKTLTKEEEEHRELLRKQSIRKASKEVQDMVNYIIFLVLFLVVVMNGRDDDTPFKMSLNLMNQLQEKPFPARVSHVHKTFEDVANVNEVYHYLSGVFYDAVYAGVSFDGDASFPEGITYSPKGMIGGYGQIWGPIRIGQLRVKDQKCEGAMAELLGLNTTLCYPEYSHNTASTTPFGYGETYTADEPPDAGVYFTSPSERRYPGPNFNVYLNSFEPATCNPSTRVHCPQYETIESLRTHKFFDMATRAIFIDLTVYNANFNQVSTIRLFFEQTASGGVSAKVEFITYRLYNYINSADYIRLGCQMLILILVTYELYKEFRTWRSIGSDYLVPTNIMFVVNFLLFYNMFIVIITDAYVEVQDELESTAQVELNSISKEIVQHILYNLIFRIPIVGPRYLKPMYELAMKRTKEIVVTIQHRTSATSLISAVEAKPVAPINVKGKNPEVKMRKPSSTTALASVRESSCEIDHLYTSVLQKVKTHLSTLEQEGTLEDVKRFKAQLELYAAQCDGVLAS
ncbi:hypothetical protein THRCLA_07344 [Thraustotheca clavata]|uniref:Polycystin domain-containing protein n=1 Tax=Thraustotheca clavata TaxID=74557 RepID=A0A1V9ZE19_9STRA|nr:hypothetical protein THRCLA_07344 [Thraustotheca clavata]